MSAVSKQGTKAIEQLDMLMSINREKNISLNSTLSTIIGTVLLVLSDLVVLEISLVLAYLIRAYLLPVFSAFHGTPSISLVQSLWWVPVIFVLTLAYAGLYHKRLAFWQEVQDLTKSASMAIILAVLYLFLSKSAELVSRPVIVLTYFISLFLLPLNRYLVKKILTGLGLWVKPILILGAGNTAKLIICGVNREETMGYRPLGVLDDDPDKKRIIIGKWIIPVLGQFKNIEQVMKRTGVRDVLLAVPGMESRKLVELTNRLQQVAANIMLVPDLFGIPLSGIEVNYLFNERTIILSITNNLASPYNQIIKRIFDFIFGIIIFCLSLPIMLVLIILIRIDSQGPAIYDQLRIGRNGVLFKCYKFRTMYLNNDEILNEYLKDNPQAALEWTTYNKLKKHDPRVTRVGRVLRKFSLDELPQIINVLKGDMSFVGPRPYLPRELDQIGPYIEDIKKVRPGITGLWQVGGRNDIDFTGRLKIDGWYVRNWSVWLDLTLMIRTIGVVLGRKGAY